MEKYKEYFNEFAREDVQEILDICGTADKLINERFHANIGEPELVAVIFSKIYTTILNKLESLEKEYADFKINICDRLEIGYSTKQDEDDEKQGNFMVFIRHLNKDKKNDGASDPQANTVERAVQWNTENIVKQPELSSTISVEALETLKSIGINIGLSELIFPIFVTVYEEIVNYITIKRRETNEFEYEINFISCFFIGIREGLDDEDDVIYIRPNIEAKLQLKNDVAASSKYE